MWINHKKKKKHDALVARLKRNADGKFSNKQYKKDIKEAVKYKKEEK